MRLSVHCTVQYFHCPGRHTENYPFPLVKITVVTAGKFLVAVINCLHSRKTVIISYGSQQENLEI